MNAHYQEWLNLTVRWIHLTVGIAWIGASFYFNWLENNLNRLHGLRDGLAGNLWAIHGGGFYYLEKFKAAPPKLPDHLHWFKWEAYFTWLSGMLLLVIVYYMTPSAYLLDPQVSDISAGVAIAICVFTLVAGWIVYDLLCRSPLGRTGWPFALVGFLIIVAVSHELCALISARAAYLHVGALIGTIMAGNVFRVIIPSQKALVAAAIAGGAPDPALGANALRRSRHNNYLTLPVLFIMLSNHFPSTYGHSNSWLVLSAIIFIGVAVRHYFNVRKSSPASVVIIPLAIAALAGLAVYTSPTPSRAAVSAGAPVEFATVRAIIAARCTHCHSARPEDELFLTAPNGIMFDTPEQIRSQAARIKIRAVESKTMPLVNETGMTEEERILLGRWIDGGAKID